MVPTTSMELKSSSLAIPDTIALAPLTFSAWPMGCGAGGVRDLGVEVRTSVFFFKGKIFNSENVEK